MAGMLIKKIKRRFHGKAFKLIATAIIFILLDFIIGSIYQSGKELTWCVQTGIKFLEIKGYKIEVNAEMIKTGIAMYKGNINRWLNQTNEIH